MMGSESRVGEVPSTGKEVCRIFTSLHCGGVSGAQSECGVRSGEIYLEVTTVREQPDWRGIQGKEHQDNLGWTKSTVKCLQSDVS